jgi:putative oxidoreductase
MMSSTTIGRSEARPSAISGARDRITAIQHAAITRSGVLLVMRVVLGWIFMYHGAGKLFNFKHQGGISGTTLFFHSQGIPAAHLMAYVVGSTEFFGGLLVLLGIATPLVGLALAGDMVVAMISTTWAGGMVPKAIPHSPIVADGFEIDLALLALSLAVAALGAGRFSGDSILGLTSGRRQPA